MEYMGALTSAHDTHQPSLFELLSASQLDSLLPPTLRYLLAQATQHHPRYLIHILNSFDEVYAALSLLVDRHFLRAYGGGFTENFYALKRERVLNVRAPRIPGGETQHALPRAQLGAADDVREALRLRERDVWKNIAVMVGIPYLKRKLDEGYDIHAASTNSALVTGPSFTNRDALPPHPTIRQRIFYYYKWFLRKVYPSLNAAYYFALLAFHLAYLFGASRFHDPLLWLVETRIRRLGEADYRAQAMAEQAAMTATQSDTAKRRTPLSTLLNPFVLANIVWPRLLSSLRILLPTSVFALKFLEWWHASDFARQLARKAAEDLELPPPVIRQTKKGAGAMNEGKSKGKAGAETTLNFTESPPQSRKTGLPIYTVPAIPQIEVTETGTQILGTDLCPICVKPIQTATATPYGYVFCYQCIHRWVEGISERQESFMKGDIPESVEGVKQTEKDQATRDRSREGKWESGAGRCAVTGMRILGGTGGLRRIVV